MLSNVRSGIEPNRCCSLVQPCTAHPIRAAVKPPVQSVAADLLGDCHAQRRPIVKVGCVRSVALRSGISTHGIRLGCLSSSHQHYYASTWFAHCLPTAPRQGRQTFWPQPEGIPSRQQSEFFYIRRIAGLSLSHRRITAPAIRLLTHSHHARHIDCGRAFQTGSSQDVRVFRVSSSHLPAVDRDSALAALGCPGVGIHSPPRDNALIDAAH